MARHVSMNTDKVKRTRKSSATRQRQPKPHVISLRVSDREKHLLEQISQKKAKNVSTVVRELLENWLAR